MEFDFGLTALGEKFHMDWRYDGPNPQDVVRQWAGLVGSDEAGLEELRLLREDVHLLLASPLSDDEIHALWRVSAMFYPYFPVNEVEPPRGRAWLMDIDHELRPYVQRSAAEFPTTGTAPESARSAVVALAERLAPRAELPLEPLSVRTVIAAVGRCAREVSAALAFRFLLRAYAAYDSPVPSDAWSSFEALNHSFGYGEFVLETIAFLREV
ncbi:hypothetical protein [Streptomyces abikoensis]|uniref:hypothetical protein n=1 Tax=Streptomyces abikoensis TaxID=97398 RepID=UPI00167C43EC|nr:hypothetical protein [Streptomyces abikoensis]GGP39027.1 hypothetical protein GCM10010214_10340 [Streptomyces abikoensis]